MITRHLTLRDPHKAACGAEKFRFASTDLASVTCEACHEFMRKEEAERRRIWEEAWIDLGESGGG
jgi:hypothetical protein